MALFSPVTKRTLFSTPPNKHRSLSSSPSSPSDQAIISTAVTILKHDRSKSRWTHLRSLFPTGFHPSQVSQITLQLRNNPHLALSFFLFTLRHSLCHHSLLSYSTIVHILCRGRLKSHAQTLIQSALCQFQDTHHPDNSSSSSSSSKPQKIFETLIKTYRVCDSAPFVFDLLIKACLQSKRIDQSVEIVRMLRSRGIYPTVSTCNSLIQSVSRSRGCYAGYDIYREVFGFDGESGNRVVSGGVKVVAPNAHTFNIIMVAFYRDGLMEDVEEVWVEMVSLNCVPNAYGYSVLMAAYCEDGKIEEAIRVWEEMQVKNVKHDVVAYNTLIGGFCRIGEVGRAKEFFREMVLSGVESTCVTFEHLINGHCKIGDVDSAMLLYKDMSRRGFRPEGATIDELIMGLCGKSRVSEALEIMRVAIKKQDIILTGKSYQFLIKVLCEEGRMEEASKLQAEMVGKGFEPNLVIYGAFIDGYMKQGNKELAGKLRKEMLQTQMTQEDR